ncbi:MAG: hypothetical protein ACRD8U_06435 [Pyrinomonadaceae bacterium]
MSFEHDELAHRAGVNLLDELRKGAALWAAGQISNSATYWHGMAEWPRPDVAFQDLKFKTSLAIEFKPPNQSKREYVTGLGQAISYLDEFDHAALIVPTKTIDGFAIGTYLQKILTSDHAVALPIGLFEYEKDPGPSGDLKALVHLRARPGKRPGIPRGVGKKVFWSYWRDLSNYDLLSLLACMLRRNVSFDLAFMAFWKNEMVTGLAKDWEGNRRKPRKQLVGSATFKAERLNSNLSLRQIGLIDSAGRLTAVGYDLSRVGLVYGPDSLAFRMNLSKAVLSFGRHIELIFWVDEQQHTIASKSKRKSSSFFSALDKRLQEAGIIPKVPGKAGKQTFLRDEQKLWNKLGLLVQRNAFLFSPKRRLPFQLARDRVCAE